MDGVGWGEEPWKRWWWWWWAGLGGGSAGVVLTAQLSGQEMPWRHPPIPPQCAVTFDLEIGRAHV